MTQNAPDQPQPAAQWLEEHEQPRTEAERQVQATIRSVSRLEESNDEPDDQQAQSQQAQSQQFGRDA